MRRMSEAQIAREARRVFRKLIAPGAHIAADDAAGFMLVAGGHARAARFAIEADVMREFLARDWLRPRGTQPESWRISPAGEGWYLRARAVHEPFAAQHQARATRMIDSGQGKRAVTVNEAESPIAWLKRRRLIDQAQFEAGERLRRDFTLAQLTPRLGVDLTAPLVHGRRGARHDAMLSDTVLAAKQRFRAALIAVGPGLADLLFDVCCHLKGLGAVEQAKDWPQRSAKVVLDIALDRLALHYGLSITATARVRTRAWSAEEDG